MHSVPSFPVDALLLLGPTGSGKSPLGKTLESTGFLGRRAHHLDFGSTLRSIVSSKEHGFSREERSFLRGVLEKGLLLENERFAIARKIITAFLDRRGFRNRDLLVLNGIPRHVGQAQDISSLSRIIALVVLECSADAIFCRLQENRDDDRSGRQDDHEELVGKKIRIFYDRTTPLIDHYRSAGSSIYRIAVNERMSAQDACSRLLSLASADPPVALIAEPPER